MSILMADLKRTCKTHKCAHQGSIPGDCHIKCVHPTVIEAVGKGARVDMLSALAHRLTVVPPTAIMLVMGVVGDKTGIKNGWFNWPFNFDPMWLVRCDCFEDAAD